jgi:hypothetical protein
MRRRRRSGCLCNEILWFTTRISEREKNGKKYYQCKHYPRVEETPHFVCVLDDGLKKKKMIKEAGRRRRLCRGSWNITECEYG